MKPNFALTLSFDGIGLLHRAFPGWHLVGEVALDTADLTEALATLRETAQQLDPSGLRTKLVLPNDQVKYLKIPTSDDPEAAVLAALDGATPYAVDDLAYDWTEEDGQLYVAAVARETLIEAEAFAVDHAFNPLSIVGQPENGSYKGEPYFATTAHIQAQGVVHGEIERDPAPIRVIGTSRIAPEPDENLSPEHDEPAELPADDAAVLEAEPRADDDAPGMIEDAPTAEEELWPDLERELDAEFARERAEAQAEGMLQDTPAPDEETPAETLAEPAEEIEQTDELGQDTGLAPTASRMTLPEADALGTGTPADDDVSAAVPEEDTADPEDTASTTVSDPVSTTGPSEELTAQVPPQNKAPDAPEPSSPTLAAFSSIRVARGSDSSAAPPKLDGVTRDDAAPRIPVLPTDDEDIEDAPQAATVTGISNAALPDDDLTMPEIRPLAEDRLAQASTPSADEEDPSPLAPQLDTAPPDTPVFPQPVPEPAAAATSPSFFSRRLGKRTDTDPATRAGMADKEANIRPSKSDERQRMTVFGARKKAAVGGKPRFLGLMLTAALLVFLIGVAAWASIFLDDGLARFFREDQTPAVASLPPEDISDTQEDITLAALDPETTLPVLEDPATEILRRVSPEDLSPDEALARYAATGIWQLAPEPSLSHTAREAEEVYVISLDPEPQLGDAVALPQVAAAFTDGVFFTPPSPPPAETTFTLDPRGLVLATPEGAVTADGIQVFAGRPAVVPPPRNDDTATPQVTETDGNAPAADAPVNPLAALRPQARPADAAEQIERLALSGRTRDELAALRPKLRPTSAQEAAEAARQAAAADAARSQAEAEAATAARASTVDLAALEGAVADAISQPDPFAGATGQAVRASLKPTTRPSDFAATVERSRSLQQQAQDQEESQPVRVAAAQKVTPNIPSTASVAKAATERNALKFKRVNLIGVYGTTSNRRALVRMSNGRYKKVKVGDRLDGGRVNAIGDGELRYQKGGRSIVLKMPRG